MKILKLGRAWGDHLRYVFVIVEVNGKEHIIASSEYNDKSESDMYWFCGWVQEQIDAGCEDSLTLFDMGWLNIHDSNVMTGEVDARVIKEKFYDSQ